MVEGARLESVCWGNSTVGSNPNLSANIYFHSVNDLALSVYVLYAVRLEKYDGVVHPGAPHIGLRLFLSLTTPRRVVLLCSVSRVLVYALEE